MAVRYYNPALAVFLLILNQLQVSAGVEAAVSPR